MKALTEANFPHGLSIREIAERNNLAVSTVSAYAARDHAKRNKGATGDHLFPLVDMPIGTARRYSAAAVARWEAARPGAGTRTDLEHRVTGIDGGAPGVRSGKTTEAVARCSCGATGRGPSRTAARKALTAKHA